MKISIVASPIESMQIMPECVAIISRKHCGSFSCDTQIYRKNLSQYEFLEKTYELQSNIAYKIVFSVFHQKFHLNM